MAVYVDDAFIPFRRMKMCHMVADTVEELHEMAEKLGLRKWFQKDPRMPHYDICKSKREEAVALGAREISYRWDLTRFVKWKKKPKGD